MPQEIFSSPTHIPTAKSRDKMLLNQILAFDGVLGW